MSAQTRYRTLVHNISRVYSSPDAGRTELLQAGIDEIVVVMSPASASGWRMVKSDTERLLRVWSAKEGDSDVAQVVADQITGLLEELSTAAPALDRISHVNPYPSLVVEDFTPVSRLPFAAPAPAPAPLVTVTKAEEEEEESEVASVPADDESEQEEEDSDDASAPASVVAPLVEEKEVVVAEAEEVEEVEEEEEVVEPEEEEVEEEEEEAGMEVEQVMIRGRTYWKDTNTNKLYAVVRGEDGEDDVGDEVGVLENGKPRFLAK